MPMKVDLENDTADHFYILYLLCFAPGERAEWVNNTICRVGFRKSKWYRDRCGEPAWILIVMGFPLFAAKPRIWRSLGSVFSEILEQISIIFAMHLIFIVVKRNSKRGRESDEQISRLVPLRFLGFPLFQILCGFQLLHFWTNRIC